MKIGSIVIHCYDFDRTVAFWQAALHYVPREPAKDGWVVLRDPEDKGPNLSFQGRDRRPRSRSWLHLDLYTAHQQAEVERLVALGARRYPWRYRAGDDFIVLEDPGGALFCVVQKADNGEGQGWVFPTRSRETFEAVEGRQWANRVAPSARVSGESRRVEM